jgi:hypothetical protein
MVDITRNIVVIVDGDLERHVHHVRIVAIVLMLMVMVNVSPGIVQGHILGRIVFIGNMVILIIITLIPIYSQWLIKNQYILIIDGIYVILHYIKQDNDYLKNVEILEIKNN